LTFNDAQIDFNDTQCVSYILYIYNNIILHAKISYALSTAHAAMPCRMAAWQMYVDLYATPI